MLFSIQAANATPATTAIAAQAAMGEALTSPGAVSLTNRYVTRGGQPWLPVMGEYHFSRDRASRWETELLKMKAGGVDVVATYLLWIVHEEHRGQVRWDGDRDIREFLRLAHKHGLQVMLRIGPWAHGETRNGGFPDWVQALPIAHRTNDPEYQSLVRDWYAAVAEQVGDFLRTPDDQHKPIIGIQTDNELYDQPDHLSWLRSAAEAEGLHAPLWTATGWGGAQLPDDLMPIFAGYSDGFWDESDVLWPSFAHTHFEFSTARDDLTVGADLRSTAAIARAQDERYPWVTCELGSGMAVAYHRRPLVQPNDVAALSLVKLGSGSAWQGYYMYHGGMHVVGADSTFQESHDTGYPNDMPARDYDFYAPIGAHGQLREHYHLLRRQHLFIQQYGPDLVTSTAVLSEPSPQAPRWSYRGDDHGGHVFVNNHQPAAEPLPSIPDVQFRIEFGGHDAVDLPAQAFTLEGGAFFHWPVRTRLGTLPTVSATVEPITEVTSDLGTLVIAAATPGVPIEFVFEDVEPHEITGASVDSTVAGRVYAHVDAALGPDCTVTVRDTTIVVLDAETAGRTWRGDVAGRDSVIVFDGGVLFDQGRLRLLTERAEHELLAHPPLETTSADLRVVDEAAGPFARYTVRGPAPLPDAGVAVVAAGDPLPLRTGGSVGRASGPKERDFDDAARVRVTIPAADDASPADSTVLSLTWSGDVARALIDGHVVSDQFWYGREWDLPLPALDTPIEVDIAALPFDPHSPVFVDPGVRPQSAAPVLELGPARLVRVRDVLATESERPAAKVQEQE